MMPRVPDVILNNLKCSVCKNWLSCGPVRVLPKGGSVCGRCRNPKIAPPLDRYRHFAYEALACYFRFPCKYWTDHCPKMLPFKKVLQHEEGCGYGSCCNVCCCHPTVLCRSDKKLDLRAAVNLEITPDEVLQYLRCSICAGYLSCAPVFVAIDGTSTCHRCSTQYDIANNSEYIRDTKFETFVDMMVFPCVFRYEGCTKMYKFGEQMWQHETECPYGTITYNREQRRSRQQEFKRSDSQQQQQRRELGQKERGVIETLSGHIYATITANAPLFRPGKLYGQEMFIDEFQRHRENLANRWGRAINSQPQKYQEHNGGNPLDPRYNNENPKRHGGHVSPGIPVHSSFSPADGAQPSQVARNESVYENRGFTNGLIDELKLRQNLKKSAGGNLQANGNSGNNGGNGRASDLDSNASVSGYYNRDNGPRRMEYSVYN